MSCPSLSRCFEIAIHPILCFSCHLIIQIISLPIRYPPPSRSSPGQKRKIKITSQLTRRQALLDLVGLVGILEVEGIKEAFSAELQLDVLGLCGFLEPGA